MFDQSEDSSDVELVSALRSLNPKAARADPIAAAFAAGKNSAVWQIRRWRVTTLFVSLLFGSVLIMRPVAAIPARENEPMAVAEKPVELGERSERNMEQAVLAGGIDALPASHSMTIIQNEASVIP